MSNAVTYYGIDRLSPQLHTYPLGTFCIVTDKASNKDGPNEDSVAIIPVHDNHIVVVLADGVGGHVQGDVASRLAVEVISKELMRSRPAESDLNTGIISSMDRANKAIIKLGTNAATTIVLAEITDRIIRTYHAGDSIALLTGQRGKIKMQTIAHSPVGYAMEAGLIDEQEAMESNDRHIVSNIAGYADMRIELGAPLKTAARDTLLLASDGVTDNLLPDEIVALIRKGPIVEAADGLMRACDENMHKPGGHIDDHTAILFRRT